MTRALPAESLRMLTVEDEATLLNLWTEARRRDKGSPRHRRLARLAWELETVARTTPQGDAAQLAGAARVLRGLVANGAELPHVNTLPGQESARRSLESWLRAAHESGYTFEALGQVVGVTRERIRQLASKADPSADHPSVIGPRKLEFLPWPTPRRPWNKFPRPVLPDSERVELTRVYALGSQLRGNVAADDPRRVASEAATAKIAELIDERGFSHGEIAEIVGVSIGAIRARLRNHGYRGNPCPSQSGYRGNNPHRPPRRAKQACTA